MKRLCEMKNCLISAAQSQMSNLQNCDAEELGEVIDMIKDIEQAIYYCTITKAMKEKSDDEEPQRMYYKESIRKKKRNVPMDYYDRYEDEDEREYPIKIYDSREGKSPERRRMYMESKELHHDQAKKLKELEEYMQELNADILEMIEGASQEEKQLLQKKNKQSPEKTIPHKYISRKYSILKPLETNVEEIFNINSSKESNS